MKNDRIKIWLGANPFLLLWCNEIKNKGENYRSLLKLKKQ